VKPWTNPLGFAVYGFRPRTGKRHPRVFNESKEPPSPGRLVIHRDREYPISVLVLRPNRRKRWVWLRWCDSIEQRDFARLSVKDRKRIRKLEAETGQILVVPDGIL